MITQGQIVAKEQPAKPSRDTVKARLKWFNIPKGFGFVNPEDHEDIDAFLHITTLQDVGAHALGEGASLICEIEYGDKGAHVKRIEEIIDPGVLPAGTEHGAQSNDLDVGRTQKMHGMVKWYKPDEGFGFVIPEDGMKDVFIHKTCLDRHEIKALLPGQKIFMTFRVVPKGREVVSFKLVGEE